MFFKKKITKEDTKKYLEDKPQIKYVYCLFISFGGDSYIESAPKKTKKEVKELREKILNCKTKTILLQSSSTHSRDFLIFPKKIVYMSITRYLK